MKCVVLSGATGGMGLATAKLLVANGYHVFGIDINEPAEKFEGFDYINADVTKEKEIVKALEYVKQKTTEIDAIISMASIYQMGSLVEINEEDFIRIFDINVFGIYRLIE